MKFQFVFYLFLFVSCLYSQTANFEKNIAFFNPGKVETAANHRPYFADLDSDGDMDLVMGEYHGRIIFYRNTGSAVMAVWEQELHVFENIDIPPVSGPPFSAPALADIDNDQDQDLVVGVRGSSSLNDLYFYRNEGSQLNPDWQEENGVFVISEGELAVPEFADLDNDGDLDLTLGDTDGTLHYYRNTGDEYVPVWQEVVSFYLTPTFIDVGTRSSPVFCDLDGDGDLDLIVGGGDGRIYYYKNTGTVSNPVFTADTQVFAGIDADDNANPALADLDGDGDFDLTVGNWELNLFYFENTGTAQNAEWTLNNEMYAGIDAGFNASPELIDLDGDDILELVIGNQNPTRNAPFLLYVNTGTNENPVWHSDATLLSGASSLSEKYTTPVFFDLDNDGDKDLVSGAWDGSIYFFENTGTAQLPQWSFDPLTFLGIDVGNYSVPFFADLDGDGDADLTIGETFGELTYFINNGTAADPQFDAAQPDTGMFENIDVGDNSSPVLIDMDSDGDLDLIVAEGEKTGGTLEYFENTGSPNTPVWTHRDGYFQYLDFDIDFFPIVKSADVNADGKPELILGEQSGALKIYLNKSSQTTNNGPVYSGFRPLLVQDSSNFYISGTITDQDGVFDDNTGSTGQGVYLLWDDDGEIDNSANEVQLDLVQGDTFQTISLIPSQFKDATFVYKVFAYDMHPVNQSQSSSALLTIIIQDDDSQPPVFMGFYPDSAEINHSFQIKVSVLDESGIYDDNTDISGQGAYLLWDTDGELNSTYNVMQLSIEDSGIGSVYSADNLMQLSSPGNLVYRVYIYDNDFDNYYFADREQAISGVKTIEIYDSQIPGDDDTDPPQFSNIMTNPVAIYDTTFFEINAEITDPSGIYDDNSGSQGQGVHIRYDSDGETDMDYNEVQMDLVSGNVFRTTALLGTEFWGNNFVFRVYAYDNDFDEANPADRKLGISSLFQIDIMDDDQMPPDFSLITPPNIEVGQPFTIKAVITDPSGIYDDLSGSDGQGVYLSWDIDGELANSANELTMSVLQGDTFRIDTDIPGQPSGTQLLFNITAWDDDFDNNAVQDRSRANSQVRNVIIYQGGDTDIDGPVFNSFSPDTVLDNQSFNISCRIDDPSGVYDDESGSDGQGAFLLWDNDGELSNTSNEVQLRKLPAGEFQTINALPAQPWNVSVLYQVFAYDDDSDAGSSDRSLGISLGRTVFIQDDDDIAPQFSEFSPQQIIDSERFHISCRIEDLSGIYDDMSGSRGHGVYCIISTDSLLSSDFIEIQMQETQPGIFRTVNSILPGRSHQKLFYQVYAFDNDFDNANIKDRKQGISDFRSVLLQDDDTTGPTFSEFAPQEVSPAEPFKISCTITDTSGIFDDQTGSNGQGVYCIWDDDGELELDFKEIQMSRTSGNRYETVSDLHFTTSANAIEYRVAAYDNDFDGGYASDRTKSISTIRTIAKTTGELDLQDFAFAPNPFSEESYFIFKVNKEAKFELTFFTISGEKTSEIEFIHIPGQVNEYKWDGTNASGKRLASGVYIYKMKVSDGTKTIKKSGKIAIVR